VYTLSSEVSNLSSEVTNLSGVVYTLSTEVSNLSSEVTNLSGVVYSLSSSINISYSASEHGFLQTGGILQQWGHVHISTNPTNLSFAKVFGTGSPWSITLTGYTRFGTNAAEYANVSGLPTQSNFLANGWVPSNGSPGYRAATISAYYFAVGRA
jgi:hypothetical protein